MFRKLFPIIAVLMILALLMTACASAEEAPAAEVVAEEPVAEEPMEEAAPEATGGILARVKERGKVVCGGRTDLAGFGMLDDAGNNIGFDIDICRAVAAAVLGDPNAIEVVPLTAADRWSSLADCRS